MLVLENKIKKEFGYLFIIFDLFIIYGNYCYYQCCHFFFVIKFVVIFVPNAIFLLYLCLNMIINMFTLVQKLPQEAANLSQELNKTGHVDETVICVERVPAEPLQVNKSSLA